MTTETKHSSKAWDLALGAAARYRRLVSYGDIVLAEQERRSIEALVGQFVDGRLVIPAEIRVVMGLAQYVVIVRGHERFCSSHATRAEAERRQNVLLARNWHPDPMPRISIEICDVAPGHPSEMAS